MTTFLGPSVTEVIELPAEKKRLHKRWYPQEKIRETKEWGRFVIEDTGLLISDCQVPIGTVCFIVFQTYSLFPHTMFLPGEPAMKIGNRCFLTRAGVTDFYGSTKVIVPVNGDGTIK